MAKKGATLQTSERSPIEVARELRRWMQRTGTTQGGIAKRLGITQPHVSQILAGQFGWTSRSVRRFCAIAKVETRASRPRLGTSRSAERTFVAAFLEAWDGTPAGRRRIEALIRSVAGTLDRPP